MRLLNGKGELEVTGDAPNAQTALAASGSIEPDLFLLDTATVDCPTAVRVLRTMLFVDVDGLKTINDTFGHRAGDLALIQVAELLESGVRKSDFVARIGGDEFGILLENADEGSASETAARLVDVIAACEFCHDGECLPLSVAIGVGVINANDCAEDVMARADEQMYRRKAAA